MPSLVDGVRMRFRLTHGSWAGDEAQFSLYTGRRDPSRYDDIAAEMADFLDNIMADTAGVAEIIDGGVDTVSFFIDEWQNPVLAQDSWGNAYQLDAPGPAQPSNVEAASLAVALSRQTQDSRVPQRRSYNRCYIPFINKQNTTLGGKFDGRDQLLTALQTFHSSLQGIPLDTGVDGSLAGLCNAVYSGTPSTIILGAEIFRSDIAFVDNVYDHQRRRVAQYQPSRRTVPLTAGGTLSVGRLKVPPPPA